MKITIKNWSDYLCGLQTARELEDKFGLKNHKGLMSSHTFLFLFNKLIKLKARKSTKT